MQVYLYLYLLFTYTMMNFALFGPCILLLLLCMNPHNKINYVKNTACFINKQHFFKHMSNYGVTREAVTPYSYSRLLYVSYRLLPLRLTHRLLIIFLCKDYNKMRNFTDVKCKYFNIIIIYKFRAQITCSTSQRDKKCGISRHDK